MDFTRINLIHYAIPGFILLILVELVFSAIAKRELYGTVDTFSSLAMGIGNVVTDLFQSRWSYYVFMVRMSSGL
jgi:hypothetical protein